MLEPTHQNVEIGKTSTSSRTFGQRACDRSTTESRPAIRATELPPGLRSRVALAGEDAHQEIREQSRVAGQLVRRSLRIGDENRFHMIFQGNPGTGKTTVGRLVAEMLHKIGVLPTKDFRECRREDLVAGYPLRAAAPAPRIARAGTPGRPR